jgi:hypothetical protein
MKTSRAEIEEASEEIYRSTEGESAAAETALDFADAIAPEEVKRR